MIVVVPFHPPVRPPSFPPFGPFLVTSTFLCFGSYDCHSRSPRATRLILYENRFTPPRAIRRVNLARNAIAEVGDQTSNKFLRELVLDENQISVISGLSKCGELDVLSVSENKLIKITGLENLPIRNLRLSRNAISSVAGLETLARLQTLDLSGNQIAELDGLQHLSNLRRLNLAENLVAKPEQMAHLRELELLTDLDLSGNPVQGVADYRLDLTFRLQRLERLDAAPVTAEEKVAAVDLFSPAPDVVAAINHAMHTAQQVYLEPELKPSTTASPELPYPILVLAGPSGSGKRPLRRALVAHNPLFAACPAHTTRAQDDEEAEGDDYHFISRAEFENMVNFGGRHAHPVPPPIVNTHLRT